MYTRESLESWYSETHAWLAQWVIPWLEDDPGLTAPELWLNRTIQHGDDAQAYGASGFFGIHWRTRAVGPQWAALAQRGWQAGVTSDGVWSTWAAASFGPKAGPAAAAVFGGIDSFDTPRPVNWVNGPGGLRPDATQCGQGTTTYAFVDTFCALGPVVSSDPQADAASMEQFNYWCDSFQYMRAIAATECAWSQYTSAFDTVSKIRDPAQRIAQALALVIPARAALVGNATVMMTHQLRSVSTVGERGITTNLHSHSLVQALFSQDTLILQLANLTQLPADCVIPTDYQSDPMLRVPSPRSVAAQGESLTIKSFVLAPSARAPTQLQAFVRPLGATSQPWTPVAVSRVTPGRSVFVTDPIVVNQDIEWYMSATLADGTQLLYPPGAPTATVSVVVMA